MTFDALRSELRNDIFTIEFFLVLIVSLEMFAAAFRTPYVPKPLQVAALFHRLERLHRGISSYTLLYF